MEQKDYLIKLIEEAARVLGEIIFLRKHSNPDKALELISESSISLIDINIDELLSLHNNNIIDYVVNKKQLGIDKITVLTDLLCELANCVNDTEQSLNANKKAYLLLSYVNDNDSVYSFERISKLNLLEQLCKTNTPLN